MKYRYLILAMAIFFGLSTSAAVLIEDGGKEVNSSRLNVSNTSAGTTGLSLRARRKLGLGVEAAGSLGLLGAKAEINLTRVVSFGGGFGIGSGYQSFNAFFKRAIGGDSFVPYVGMGFSRWYSSGDKRENFSSSSPGFLAEKFLDAEEKRTGEFAESLIYPAAGIQYYQLSGEWAGASLYAEILFLVNLDGFVSAATGGVGFMYFF